ncbi:serine/threonine-protein phosphatase 6 regulatory ankyrin repeat subunit C-like [Littorina saxatilis]|uniref:serine/threonine-protein phosphatase 6 regulatory ankyrin repeat subunit C-like n=1 Tax=Littorina saxatilis TaxID=31220 RepID=UPI0038B4742F
MAGNIHVAAKMKVYHNLTMDDGYTQIKDQSKVEIDHEASVFISTPAYRHALQLLEVSGLLFITGPACSGKTSIATALLRHYQQQDRTPLVLHRYGEFRQHVGGDRRQVILLEDIFGDGEFLYKRYKKWSQALTVLRVFCEQKKCIAIITIHDTVITELKEKCNFEEKFTDSPVLDLKKSDALTATEKSDMLEKHVHKAGKTLTESILQDILVVDTSKHMFPKCCKDFVQSVDTNVLLKDIFTDGTSVMSTPYVEHDAPARVDELMNAVKAGDADSLRDLLHRGVSAMSKDDDGNHPLHQASKCGNVEVARILVAWNADVNAVDFRMHTALHYASSMGHKDVVCFLLKKGADINVAEKDGWTAVHLAASKGHTGILELLITNNATQSNNAVNVPTVTGDTPLHVACTSRQLGTVKMLLQSGADPHASDQDGKTPLHTACFHGCIDIAYVLMQYGASLEAKDKLDNVSILLSCDRHMIHINRL